MCCFFFTDPAPTEIYTLSLHDALPILELRLFFDRALGASFRDLALGEDPASPYLADLDRKSTRLNSSHDQISYAVFCLKKKKNSQHVTHLSVHPYSYT